MPPYGMEAWYRYTADNSWVEQEQLYQATPTPAGLLRRAKAGHPPPERREAHDKYAEWELGLTEVYG